MFYEKNLMKSNIILKKLFAIWSQFSKGGWNGGDGDVDGDDENFFIQSHQKKVGRNVQC